MRNLTVISLLTYRSFQTVFSIARCSGQKKAPRTFTTQSARSAIFWPLVKTKYWKHLLLLESLKEKFKKFYKEVIRNSAASDFLLTTCCSGYLYESE